MRRVCYINHAAVWSGGEIAMFRTVTALKSVSPVVVLGEEGPLAERLRDAGIDVHLVHVPPGRLGRLTRRAGLLALVSSLPQQLRYLSALIRILRRERPDLVHANSVKSGVLAGIAARVTQITMVWHIRDRVSTDYFSPAAVRVLRSLTHLLPDGVIANSETSLATLKKLRSPALAIPSPVDDGLFALQRRARPSDAPFTFLMLGRIAPWKGQDLLVRAFHRAFRDGHERLVVVGGALFGETEYEASLTKLVTDLGLSQRVHLAGHHEDVSPYLSTADVLVHASTIPEPFGLVVVEAMAAGVPVIAAGAGGPAEVIEHGVNGLLFPPGDEDALARVLVFAREHCDTLAECSARARSDARAYSTEQVVAAIEDFYSVVGGRRW